MIERFFVLMIAQCTICALLPTCTDLRNRIMDQ